METVIIDHSRNDRKIKVKNDFKGIRFKTKSFWFPGEIQKNPPHKITHGLLFTTEHGAPIFFECSLTPEINEELMVHYKGSKKVVTIKSIY